MRRSAIIAVVVIAAGAASAASAGPQRPGAWTITSHTRIVDPTNAMVAMPRRVAGSVRSRIPPESTVAYCVIGDTDLIDAKDMQVLPAAQCELTRKSKSADTYYLFYRCGGEKENVVDGQIIMTFDSETHYTGRTSWSAVKMRYVKWESIFEGKWTGDTCPGH